MQNVIIVSGSFAGLTVALQLGQANQKVVVIDTNRPKRRMWQAAHSVSRWDEAARHEIPDQFLADLVAYRTATLQSGTATAVSRASDDCTLKVDAGNSLRGRRILLVHGVRNIMPDIPGASEISATELLFCAYLDGCETHQKLMAVLIKHPMSAHQVHLMRANLIDDITLLTDCTDVTEQPSARAEGVFEEPRAITSLRTADFIIFVTLEDGAMAVLATADCAPPAHTLAAAIGDRATAGIECHQSLVFPQFVQPIEAAA